MTANGPLEQYQAWTELIRRRCGLSMRESQMPLLADLLDARARAHGFDDPRRYYDLLEAEVDGGAEWTEVVEHLVSHETSFFRHAASFEVLRTDLLPELKARPDRGTRALSMWSAGCSTGQEAYSLAMVALADDPRTDVTVWGADISRVAIETARAGRYPEKAVASIPDEYRGRFLRPTSSARHEFDVTNEVRRHVRFIGVDLYTACSMGLMHDVIFCHNVLIYFAADAGMRLMSMLSARLSIGGYLLPGPGEAAIACPAGLEPIQIAGVRAFRRSGRFVKEARP